MTTPTDEQPPHEKSHRTQALWGFTILLFIAVIIWVLLWIFYFQYYESTDDAYANGNMVNIQPVVSGSVVAFFVDNTDRVVEGQLLVAIDSTPFELAYQKALADLAATVLQVRRLYDDVTANRADVENAKVVLKKAQYDFDNRSRLVASKAVSNEDFVHARDALSTAELTLKSSEAKLLMAMDAAGNTVIEQHPLIEQQKANVRQAYYNLEHCVIYAPCSGYVAQRSVEVGQSVAPSQALMAIIPADYVWVDANFKETQLTNIRVGQPATVWLDMYGSHVIFKGKVVGIASGSGSVFSLIPPQNATGNWIKIVQRLAVRISLDPEVVRKYPVRLGVSAEVSVDTSDRSLPMLTSEKPLKSVAATKVFDLNFDKINKTIDEVIQANLKQ